MPDSEKRRRAHFVIDSGLGIDTAAREVVAVLAALASLS
jgi:dephospho-CoA kinase